MPTPLSAEAKALIDRPNFSHLATLMADGSPQSVPVWVGREGERLIVCTSEGSLKGRNTRRDPRVALSIVDFRNPYEEVQLRGRVVELPEAQDDPALVLLDHPGGRHRTRRPGRIRSCSAPVAIPRWPAPAPRLRRAAGRPVQDRLAPRLRLPISL